MPVNRTLFPYMENSTASIATSTLIAKVTIIFSPELPLPYTKNPTELSTVNVSLWGVSQV